LILFLHLLDQRDFLLFGSIFDVFDACGTPLSQLLLQSKTLSVSFCFCLGFHASYLVLILRELLTESQLSLSSSTPFIEGLQLFL